KPARVAAPQDHPLRRGALTPPPPPAEVRSQVNLRRIGQPAWCRRLVTVVPLVSPRRRHQWAGGNRPVSNADIALFAAFERWWRRRFGAGDRFGAAQKPFRAVRIGDGTGRPDRAGGRTGPAPGYA